MKKIDYIEHIWQLIESFIPLPPVDKKDKQKGDRPRFQLFSVEI